MVQKCVVYGCSNTKDEKKGISIHPIPFYDDPRPEAVKRRRKWISFVSATRKKWTASKYSVVCSVHFTPEDFVRLSFKESTLQQRLKKDEIGVLPVPSIHQVKAPEEETSRDLRMKRRSFLKDNAGASRSASTDQEPQRSEVVIEDDDLTCDVECEVVEDEEDDEVMSDVHVTLPPDLAGQVVVEEGSATIESTCSSCPQVQEVECANCIKLQTRERKLRNQYAGLKFKYDRLKRQGYKKRKQGTNRHGGLPESVIQLPREEKQQVDQDKDEQLDVDMEDYGDDDFDIYPSSPQDEYSTEQETESDTDLSATEEETVDHSVHVTDDNLRTQPKHVVFLTQLLMLFQFCHICKADGPQVSTRQEGTMAVVTTTCRNPKCTRRILLGGVSQICLRNTNCCGQFSTMLCHFDGWWVSQ